MVKILSKSGDSLADMYDVEGSIAGIEQLETRELPIVHEMGGTVFSERISGFIRRNVTAAINQSTAFDEVSTGLPAGPYRVLGVYVQADVASRVDRAQVSLRNPLSGREIPIFIWDVNHDVEKDIRIVENGSAVSEDRALVQAFPVVMPSLGIGRFQPQRVGEEIVFRGASSAFGAGTVLLTSLVYVAFSEVGGISSRGLPVPGW